MFRFLTILFLGCFHFYGHAQKWKNEDLFVKNGFFGVMAGVALPVSDFADEDFKPASGYANPGYAMRLALNYDVLPFAGVALQYQYFNNPFNSNALLSDLRQNNSGIVFHSYSSDPWILHGMMAGVYFPMKTFRTSIDIKLCGGFLSGTMPENTANYTSTSLNRTFNVVQASATATSPAFQAGISMRYQLHKNIMITGAADFTYTEMTYTNLRSTDTYSGITIANPDYTQYYHIISLSAGIGIQFD